jgi:hypothetical protein
MRLAGFAVVRVTVYATRVSKAVELGARLGS